MKKEMDQIILYLGKEYENIIDKNGYNYIEVDIGKLADNLGFNHIKEQVNNTGAIIPLKHHVDGMKVRIDGRTFVNYSQFESGVTLPEHLAKESQFPKSDYSPHENMVLNFA